MGKKYVVFNRTDGIMASRGSFPSKKKANEWIVEFRKRFEVQGYYFTNNMQRIAPADVELEVLPHGAPFM